MKLYTEDDVIKLLLKDIGDQSQSDYAKAKGTFRARVSDTLRRARAPAPAILKALGLEKIVAYRRVT